MGVTVRQKEKGKGNPWYVFIHQSNRIKSKKVGDKKLAESLAGKIRKKLLAGEFKIDDPRENSPRFDQYAKHYIESYAKVTTKINTWRGYECILKNHLLPVWGERRLCDIKRADVKALLLEKLSGGLKTNSVINMKNLISGIYNLAIEEEVVQANPATRVCKYIRLPERKKCIAVLSKEEVSTLLGLVLQKYPQHYPVLLAAFRTGLRMGELAGLAWEDINFDANMIQVRRSYSHGLFSTPKNRKHRYVDMSGQLKQSLLGYQSARLREQGGKLPITKLPSQFASDDNVRLVFAEPDGSPADLDNFRRSKFYKYLKEANVPHIRFHDIRHTFASLLLQQGESLHYVKEQMGHASIQTTVDVYGHIVPGSNRNAVNKLDDKDITGLKVVSSAG